MDDIWTLAGWAIIAVCGISLVVEPLIFSRLAENSSQIRENKRLFLGIALFMNGAGLAAGILIVLYGREWFGG